VYFLSDLHLGCNPTGCVINREDRAIQLLRSWRGVASHVVLLGDVFEFWMEYRHYINRHHFHFLRALSELVESGVEVHILSGNHDFRLDDFFPKTLGVKVHKTFLLDVQGKRVWCQHGDGMARSDWKYRIASRILHSPVDVWLFRLLHPDWGMSLAHWVGGTSRKVNQHADPKQSEYAEFARTVLAREHCDAVIHGHNHHPGIWNYAEGTHINCGQWLFALSYAELRAGEFKIIQVEDQQS